MLWHSWEWDEQTRQERSVSSLWQKHSPAHPLPYKSSVNWIDYEGSFITYDGNRGMCNLPSKEPFPLVFQHYLKPLIKQLLNPGGVVPACCPVCCRPHVWPWDVPKKKQFNFHKSLWWCNTDPLPWIGRVDLLPANSYKGLLSRCVKVILL